MNLQAEINRVHANMRKLGDRLRERCEQFAARLEPGTVSPDEAQKEFRQLSKLIGRLEYNGEITPAVALQCLAVLAKCYGDYLNK